MAFSKLFGVGFHRTGTTTLERALEELGYSVIGMRDPEWIAFEEQDYETIRNAVDRHDGFRDMPWPLIYEWLEQTYPDARFVLTNRSTDSWVRSCRAVYKDRPQRMFRLIYGFDSFAGNEDRAASVYEDHLTAVRRYFADKPDRFLEVDFTAGDGWEKLCGFLDEPIPDRPFPHANAGAFTLQAKVKRKLMQWFRRDEYMRQVFDR